MAEQEQNYLTIIGDLVGSRRLEAKERGEVQKRFKSVLARTMNESSLSPYFGASSYIAGKTTTILKYAWRGQAAKL